MGATLGALEMPELSSVILEAEAEATNYLEFCHSGNEEMEWGRLGEVPMKL